MRTAVSRTIPAVVLLGLAALPAAAATQGGPPPFALEASLQGQNPPGGVAGDQLGTALSIDGDRLAVGVPGRWGGDTDEVGSVLMFRWISGAWSQTHVVRAPNDGLDGDRFGASVSTNNGLLAVGTAPAFGGTRGVYVFAGGGLGLIAHLMPPAGESAPSFGKSVAIMSNETTGAWLAVGAPDERAVYMYGIVASNFTFLQKLVPSDADASATFGHALALGGTADLLIVGSPGQDTSAAADSGAAYVFRRTGETWTQEAKVSAPDAATGDAFGSSVALWDATAVIGAPADDAPGAVDRGSAHVFVQGPPGSWAWQAALAPPSGTAGDAFGTSVAAFLDQALVGAPGKSLGSSGPGTGAAYPFVRSLMFGWEAGTPFTGPESDAGDAFGAAVAGGAISGVVGAPGRVDAGTAPAGAAYAFISSPVLDVREIVPDHDNDHLLFGRDVAVEGDTVAVGASGVNLPAGTAAGGVFVFTRAVPGWTVTQRLEAADPARYDQLGESVALSGDTLLAGAQWKDLAGAGEQGAAYVFRRSGGVWSQEARLVAPDAAPGDYFGVDVAVSGDTAVAGTWLGDGVIANQGTAYVFVRSGSTWTFQQKLTASDASANASFGVSVSILGDAIAVGAPSDQAGRGAVYVYRRTGTTWSEVAKLQAPDGVASSSFGYATSLEGSTLAVGAPATDGVGTFSGAVYVFVESGGSWAFQQKLVPLGATANTEAGLSVALGPDRIVSGSGGGVVNVFERTGTVWSQRPDLPPPASVQSFGRRVAASGPVALAGDWSVGTATRDVAGSAHVYRKAQADLEVTIDDGQTAAVAGAPITYQVVARHGGGDPVAGARVTTPAPFLLTGATWTCAPSPGASCSASGSGALDDLASLVARASATYTITGTVPSNLTGTLTTSARVTAPAGVVDPDPANDVAQDVDVLSRVTDLAVALGSEPTAVGAGALVTWTTDVTNLGPSDSSGAVLVHELAGHATLVSVDPPPPACLASGGSVTCALGPLAASGVRRLTVVQRADAGYLGPIVARSTVTAAETDPVSANDQRQLQVEVIPPGDAEIAHGTSLFTTVGAAGRRYRLSQRPFASYEAVVDAASGDLGDSQGPMLTLETATSTVVAASQPVGLGFSRSLRFRNDASTVVDDRYVRVASQGCSTSCGDDDVFRLRVYETTLYGPRFNNTGGQGTVLVLQTSGAAPVSGRAHFWSASGVLLATAPFDLAPRGSVALATATVPGLAGQSGTLTVSHDGAYGAVTGKTVALVPDTGASFDTPLSYRGR